MQLTAASQGLPEVQSAECRGRSAVLATSTLRITLNVSVCLACVHCSVSVPAVPVTLSVSLCLASIHCISVSMPAVPITLSVSLCLACVHCISVSMPAVPTTLSVSLCLASIRCIYVSIPAALHSLCTPSPAVLQWLALLTCTLLSTADCCVQRPWVQLSMLQPAVQAHAGHPDHCVCGLQLAPEEARWAAPRAAAPSAYRRSWRS